jgi:hypothetical protein
MQLTEEQLAILDHRCIEGGQVWADRHGNEKWMLEAVAEHRQTYLDAKASEGDNYKTASQKEADREKQLKDEYYNVNYAVKRSREYSKLNQFEMQFDDQRDGTTLWVDSINDIKAKYPKEAL